LPRKRFSAVRRQDEQPDAALNDRDADILKPGKIRTKRPATSEQVSDVLETRDLAAHLKFLLQDP
jgi:hypothetical protein